METLYKKSLFWDVPLENLDAEKHKVFIIERILSRGDLSDVKWMFKKYNKNTIKNVLKNKVYRLDKKSANFWRNYFNLS